MNNDRPILIYSELCPHSKTFLQVLLKQPKLFEQFYRMCIDIDPHTKQRPQKFYQIQQQLNTKITKVPTIITPNAEHVLSDKDAFNWLEYRIQILKGESTLKPFNPLEMASLSDQYAMKGSTTVCDNPREQSFLFKKVGKLADDNYLQTKKVFSNNKTNGFLNELEQGNNKSQAEILNQRQQFDKARGINQRGNQSGISTENARNNVNASDFMQKKQMYQQQLNGGNKPTNINFTDMNFGLAAQLGPNTNKRFSQKEKELDSKLNQLMLDRQAQGL